MPTPPDPLPPPEPFVAPTAMVVPAARPHIPNYCVKTGELPADGSAAGTAGTTVPYSVMWNARENCYGESAGEKTPTTVTAKVRVNWSQSTTFTVFARGYAFWSGGKIRRRLPMKCPWDYELYLSQLDFSKLGADAGVDAASAGWPSAEWIEYTSTFAVRPYDLKSDALTDTAGSELCRYVTRSRKYNYKERRINPGQLLFADGQPSMVPSFVPFVGSEVEYLWHMVPANAINFAAISAAMGKVNNAVFDTSSFFGERPIGGPFAAETLLFVGFSNKWNTYPMSNGKQAFDIPFLFRENPAGWNVFPKPDGTLSAVTLRGTAQKVYQLTNFMSLFTARA